MKSSKSVERFFEGRVWVDDRDFQIVKARGKGVPEFEQRFPTFETYREQVDGKYWFPTYVFIDDVLEFKTGGVHLRGSVKFKNYKKFSTGIRIADDPSDEASDEGGKPDPNKKPDSQTPAGAKKPDVKADPKKPETPPVTKKPNL